jgi:ribosomal protein S18 acetylase RimI-like enzyme
MSLPLLDKIAWHSLVGPQAGYSSGTRDALRYARGFSPIVGFADLQRPGLAALTPFCAPGEHLYCTAWTGRCEPGWQIDEEELLVQMVWDGTGMPRAHDGVARLTADHVPQVLDLVRMTQPGPFAERTIELGEYYGYFDSGKLIAMTGERMHAGSLREVSGVCTHPGFQGRGLARRLVEHLVHLQLQRDQLPFLHVMRANAAARRLYERIGFRQHQEQLMRVISRAG